MSGWLQAMAALNGRVRGMVSRATVSAIDDAPTLQSLQIELLDEEVQDAVEHFQPYGFAAHPHAEAEAIMLGVGGTRSHAVVLAVSDRRYRMKAMRQGEVALYDDLGQSVLLGRDGIVITSALGISFQTEGDFSVAAQGDVSIIAAGEMLVDGGSILIGEGASLDAARKSDAVSGSAITGGSGKVKIA